MGKAVKVSILGLGKSGVSTALFLKKKGYDVFVSEYQISSQSEAFAQKLKDEKIRVELGKHSFDELLSAKWSVFSPGIKPTTEIYQAFIKANIPIYSEIEVASWYSKANRIIAVTGSCGKTTVTTLLTEILKVAGRKAMSCGNIGNPWISEVENLGPDQDVVLELSSFQLKNSPSFRPDHAILLNIFPNHLDWHADLQDYASSKLNLFKNQSADQCAYFNEKDQQNFFKDLKIRSQIHSFSFSENAENPNFAVIHQVAKQLQIKKEDVQEVLDRFEGLEHRLEKVREQKGVLYINDSKSTTVASLKWALERSKDQSVMLIAGGIAKSKNFDEISELIQKKCKKTLLIGEASDLIYESWHLWVETLKCASLEEAVVRASNEAQSGDVVLLSPACASFDMFKNYESRGQQFKEIVQKLA
jgi:UDP-N-acetylmuramoylalanine--D-glutamate ligase